ncbi:MAG: alanine racemase [Abditibacteriota bacterium]|nr:alanine racemase [Abditibacteriota bacterium]
MSNLATPSSASTNEYSSNQSTHSLSRSPPASRPLWAEIDVRNFRHNVRRLLQLGQNRTSLLAVLKANAYGHGAPALAHVLSEAEFTDGPEQRGVQMVGVASVGEGYVLRESGIELPILLMSALLPDEAPAVVAADLTPTVFTPELASALNDQGQRLQRRVPVHWKIDTGMNRIGTHRREALQEWRALNAYPFLHVTGIYTHFACADVEHDEMTNRQAKYLEAALGECGIEIEAPELTIHAANSAAYVRCSAVRFDMARCGLMLYGLWPSPFVRDEKIELQPVMSLKARVTHVHRVAAGESVSYGGRWVAPRDSIIATLPVGYADGYPRLLTGRAEVLLRGYRVPVRGTITMDQILIDVTDFAPAVQLGEVVTLWGREGEDSSQEISVNEVADWAGTIPYEITCGVAARVVRTYVDA